MPAPPGQFLPVILLLLLLLLLLSLFVVLLLLIDVVVVVILADVVFVLQGLPIIFFRFWTLFGPF